MQLEELTLESFEPHVGTNFTIRFSDREPMELKITGVRLVMERVQSTKLKRQPFVVYLESADSLMLPQRMYPFSHDVLGDLPIFIVPVGREDGVSRYEAVFT